MIGREVGNSLSLPRLRVVVQVRGVAVRRTPASALSPPLSLSLLSPSLPPLPHRLSLSLPSTERARLAEALRFASGHYHSLLNAEGLGAQGFSTKCARLAGTLRFTRRHYHSLLSSHGFSTERAGLGALFALLVVFITHY